MSVLLLRAPCGVLRLQLAHALALLGHVGVQPVLQHAHLAREGCRRLLVCRRLPLLVGLDGAVALCQQSVQLGLQRAVLCRQPEEQPVGLSLRHRRLEAVDHRVGSLALHLRWVGHDVAQLPALLCQVAVGMYVLADGCCLRVEHQHAVAVLHRERRHVVVLRHRRLLYGLLRLRQPELTAHPVYAVDRDAERNRLLHVGKVAVDVGHDVPLVLHPLVDVRVGCRHVGTAQHVAAVVRQRHILHLLQHTLTGPHRLAQPCYQGVGLADALQRRLHLVDVLATAADGGLLRVPSAEQADGGIVERDGIQIIHDLADALLGHVGHVVCAGTGDTSRTEINVV